MSSAVLITTANNPPANIPHLEMTNVATRLITAKGSVFFWAALWTKKIVIADATGSKLLTTEDMSLIQKMGVEIEQISYVQSEELIKSRGKGFGEGQLIKFALENSILLKNESNFFKCTGKVYCRNFETILGFIAQFNIQNLFWKYLGEGDSNQPWADMRFFYTTRKFCEENLIPAYQKSDDAENLAAEYFCFNTLNEQLPTAYGLRPLLSGFSGGTNKQYFEASFGFLDFNYPCWFGK